MIRRLMIILMSFLILSVSLCAADSDYDSLVKNSISLEEVNGTNYDKYIKKYKDEYGYNIGECKRKYLAHEEYYYSEYYDHWNVDVVYDCDEIKSLFIEFENSMPEISSLSNSQEGILLKWGKVSQAKSYYVYRKKEGGSWIKIKTESANSFTDTSCENGCRYSYKVCAMKNVKKKEVVSKTSSSKSIYFIECVKVNRYINEIERSIRGCWYKNKCADGYQMKCVNDNVSRIKTVEGENTLSTLITGLSKGKTYQVSVRCYINTDDGRKYSLWSSNKSIKVKK